MSENDADPTPSMDASSEPAESTAKTADRSDHKFSEYFKKKEHDSWSDVALRTARIVENSNKDDKTTLCIDHRKSVIDTTIISFHHTIFHQEDGCCSLDVRYAIRPLPW
jgi:hypothetical protein